MLFSKYRVFKADFVLPIQIEINLTQSQIFEIYFILIVNITVPFKNT